MWLVFLKKLPYSGHEYAEDIWMFTTNFIINYDENSDVGYTLAVGVEYSQYLHPSHRNLLFFPEKKKKLFISHKVITTSFKHELILKKYTES